MRNTHNFRLAAAVSIITFLVYLPSLQNQFVGWDDDFYIFHNPYIHSFNAAFFKWAFFEFYIANWHPLTWISLAIDHMIWGLNPLGYHLENLVLHVVNTFLVTAIIIRLFEVLKRTMKCDRQPVCSLSDRSIRMTAVITGLLFGLHPLHVESVAWVSERKDLLCAMFFLLSVMVYTGYAGAVLAGVVRRNPLSRLLDKRYLLTAGFFILALLSKPMAVSLPFVLLILDWYPFQRIQSLRTFRNVFAEKLPFFAASFFSSVVTILAQRSAGAVASIGEIGLSTRVLVAAKSMVAYLWKMLLPINLMPFYPYQENISVLSWQYLFAIVVVAVITTACILTAKKQRLWLSLWSYYVITLIPVLGIVQVGDQSMADRYTYLTSLAPFLLVGILVTRISMAIDTFRKWRRTFKFVGAAAAVLVFISMSYLTVQQIGIWKNGVTLWSYVIEKEPEKIPRAYEIRGTVFYDEGQFDRAIQDYTQAIALDRKDAKIFVNRGLAYLKIGQVELAIPDFLKACELGDSFGCNAPRYLVRKVS